MQAKNDGTQECERERQPSKAAKAQRVWEKSVLLCSVLNYYREKGKEGAFTLSCSRHREIVYILYKQPSFTGGLECIYIYWEREGERERELFLGGMGMGMEFSLFTVFHWRFCSWISVWSLKRQWKGEEINMVIETCVHAEETNECSLLRLYWLPTANNNFFFYCKINQLQ